MDKVNFKYANINAKLKGMSSKRINEKDIIDLIRQNDLKSAIYILKAKIQDLHEMSEESDRKDIEQQLDKMIINDTNKIERLLSNDEKDFIKLFISKYTLKSENYKKNIKEIYQQSKKFGSELTNIIGIRIDLLNYISIYRIKKYYTQQQDEIKKYLIDVKHNFTEENIEDLIKAENFDIMKNISKNTVYKKIMGNIEEDNIEILLNNYLYSQYKRTFIKAKYNICTVIAYIYLQEYQRKNIETILGGIYYNLPKDEIRKNIIIGDEKNIGD